MNYVEYRIGKAGGAKDLFDDEAIDYIHHYEKGTPWVINSLCDTCLVYAYAVQMHKVDADVVREVIKDKGGLFPVQEEIQ